MRDWEASFLAVSAVAGEPAASSLEALGGATEASALELAAALAGATREAKARAIARVVSQIALDVDAARLG